MIIASQKRKENIAEYLLYMWQVEDLIRANKLDIELIKKNIIDRFSSLTPQQAREMTEWYESLIDMMRSEGVTVSGHLQINKNTLADLTELHNALLRDPRFEKYSALYYKVLPYIVELRSKAGEKAEDELATCFNALYGTLLMKVGGKKMTAETRQAVADIAAFIATLSAYYKKNEEEPLFEPKSCDE